MVKPTEMDTFERLVRQIHEVRAIERDDILAERADALATFRRGVFLLVIAACDSYFHELGARLLLARLGSGGSAEEGVKQYLGIPKADPRPSDLVVHYRLSKKTLVAPEAISNLLVAAGKDAEQTWLTIALEQRSRPERIQASLELAVHRRNQIAHEADWDPVALRLRPMERSHLDDCVEVVHGLVRGMNKIFS